MQVNQSKGIKPKMKVHKLTSVNWQRALKQKRVKQVLGVYEVYAIGRLHGKIMCKSKVHILSYILCFVSL
jgi:hypothetical protein